MLKKTFLILLLALVSSYSRAVEVPRSDLIVHIGVNRLSMQAALDSSINGFRLNYPGFYAKLSGEGYSNATNFVHFDLNLSLNKAKMDNGYARISRLCMNYGFGKTLDRVKFTVSPGLCYSQVAYQNEANSKGVTESRFAPSLALQTDLIILKSTYRYLGLFLEGSFMFAKPTRWVHQVAVGLSWKPSFRKEDRPMVTP